MNITAADMSAFTIYLDQEKKDIDVYSVSINNYNQWMPAQSLLHTETQHIKKVSNQ